MPPPENNPTPPGSDAFTAPGSDAAPDPAASSCVIDPDLLEILVCPLTRARLVQQGDWLIAQRPEGAGLRYPIRGGIPVLLVDHAELPEGCPSLAEFKSRYPQDIPETPRV